MCDVHHWPFIDNTPINLLHPQQLLLTVLISSIRSERDRDTTRLRKGREDGGHMIEGGKKKLMYMHALMMTHIHVHVHVHYTYRCTVYSMTNKYMYMYNTVCMYMYM